MSHVAKYADPTPTMSTQSNHDCGVGSGSLACQRSKAKAAAIDTAHCNHCMREL